MKINKLELLSALKADLKSADVLKRTQDGRIDKWRREYNGEPYGNEKTGKSSIVSRDIKKQSEWQHATIIDPFVSSPDIVKCTPITAEDDLAARQNTLLLNTQFVRKFDRYNFISKAAKVLDSEGTVVIQTGWEYEDKEVTNTVATVAVDEFGVEYITETEVTEIVVTKNQPTAKVLRNSDVFLDPTCQDDQDAAQFFIVRYESDLSSLKKDGRFKNLDKACKQSEDTYDNDYYPADRSDFRFEDKARKKQLVYEYWGNYDVDGDGIAEPIVCAWIGNVIIRLESNPYPDGKPPFIVVPFNSVPFYLHGEANAELIGDNQKVKTAIMRGLIDNMAKSNNAQVAIRKNALDTANRRKFLAGENFEYSGSAADFWQGNYNQLPGSAFDMLGLMNNEIESLTGVKSFSSGISGNALGSTATGVRGVLDSTAVRRLNIVRNISENLIKPLLRKWMSYNSEFLEEEEIVRITAEEFVPVRRDDLEGLIDIDITISTSEDNAAKAEELSFLLQTLGPSLDQSITRELMADIMDLRRMPDQAKRIRETKPEPDPVQERLKELELQRLVLENEKIKADIADKYARAGENEIDAKLKINKAEVEAAKARNLNSNADLANLKFIKEDAGISHKEQMEKEEFKRKANLDVMAFQAMNNDTQIGVVR